MTFEGSRLRLSLATVVGALPSFTVFWWLISYGTFSLQSSGFSTNFYDEQAISFLHGKLSVPSSVVSIEGFEVHGRTYMYFGPFLAIVRLPFLAIDEHLAGKLTVVSMLVAFSVLLVGIVLLYWTVRCLAPTSSVVSLSECVLIAAMVFVGSIGSVAVFLAGYVSVYQETELWAVALVVVGASLFLRLMHAATVPKLLAFGAVTLAAILTRASVGLGLEALVVALVVVSLLKAVRRTPTTSSSADASVGVSGGIDGRSRWIVGFIAVALLPIVSFALINKAKFGSYFNVPFGHQNIIAWGLATKHYVYVATLHPTFTSLSYLPTTLLAYLGPGALAWSRLFPFVNFPVQLHVVGGAQFASLGPTTSMPASMPAIFALALVGAIVVCLPRRLSSAFFVRSAVVSIRVLLLGLATGCIGVLTYATIADRYLADLLPLFLAAGIAGLVALRVGLHSLGTTWRIALVAPLVLLALWSVWVNLGLGLLFQRTVPVSTSVAQREAFASFRQHLHNAVSPGASPDVIWGGPMHTNVLLGSLYVQGACRALYQFGGSAWQGIEWSSRAGHVVLDALVPRASLARSQPLLVTGGPHDGENAFGLKVLPGGRTFEVTYFSSGLGQKVFPCGVEHSQPLAVPTNRHAMIDLVIDASTHASMQWYSAVVDGIPALAGTFPVNPSQSITVGALSSTSRSDPAVDEVMLPRFTGTLTQLPVTTPVCSVLRRPSG